MTTNPRPADVSLVIPLYNEAVNVPTLLKTLRDFLARHRLNWECLFIDDGSTDGTRNALSENVSLLPQARIIGFRRNLGKSAAYDVGFKAATGTLIATMDGDLQDDPEDLLPMQSALNGGADFVCGWKHGGKSGFHKKWLSRLFNLAIALSSGVRLHDINCPLRLFRRECVSRIHLNGDLFRFLPLLVSQLGFRIAEVKVKNLPRHAGASKFTLRRYPQGLFDLLYVLFSRRYIQRPLHFFGLLGALVFAAGFLLDLGLTVRGLFFAATIGHSALLLLGVLLMLAGLQIFLFGFIGIIIAYRQDANFTEYIASDSTTPGP